MGKDCNGLFGVVMGKDRFMRIQMLDLSFGIKLGG